MKCSVRKVSVQVQLHTDNIDPLLTSLLRIDMKAKLGDRLPVRFMDLLKRERGSSKYVKHGKKTRFFSSFLTEPTKKNDLNPLSRPKDLRAGQQSGSAICNPSSFLLPSGNFSSTHRSLERYNPTNFNILNLRKNPFSI